MIEKTQYIISSSYKQNHRLIKRKLLCAIKKITIISDGTVKCMLQKFFNCISNDRKNSGHSQLAA